MGKDWSWKPDRRTRKAIYRGNKLVARKKTVTKPGGLRGTSRESGGQDANA